MKFSPNRLICAAIVMSASAAFAQDAVKKPDTMPKDGMMKKDMTTEDCKAHMAMMKKDGMTKNMAPNDAMSKDGSKRDEAMAKQHAMCADMMSKDGMPAETMKK